MEKHINSLELQNKLGEKVTVTKTSTHRDYSHASVALMEDGTQNLMVWHLTEEAAHKYAGSKAARDLASYWAQKDHTSYINIMVVPVRNEVVLTGKDAKKDAGEIALEAADNLDAEIDAHNAKVEEVTGSGVCKCGCGDIVSAMGKSSYRPGHDARHVSSLRKAILGLDALDQPEALKIAVDQLSEKLTAKLISQLAKHSK